MYYFTRLTVSLCPSANQLCHWLACLCLFFCTPAGLSNWTTLSLWRFNTAERLRLHYWNLAHPFEKPPIRFILVLLECTHPFEATSSGFEQLWKKRLEFHNSRVRLSLRTSTSAKKFNWTALNMTARRFVSSSSKSYSFSFSRHCLWVVWNVKHSVSTWSLWYLKASHPSLFPSWYFQPESPPPKSFRTSASWDGAFFAWTCFRIQHIVRSLLPQNSSGNQLAPDLESAADVCLQPLSFISRHRDDLGSENRQWDNLMRSPSLGLSCSQVSTPLNTA